MPSSERRYPARLGRYELLAPIASGGMATVYLARATGAGGFAREVAIKLLHPQAADEYAGSPEAGLLVEARLAARVRHPAVVPVLDVGESPFGPYLVMDFVEGDTLANLLQTARQAGERLPPGIAIKILCDALDGLHAAHEARDEAGKPLGIVHRDFSPQNILVGIDGASRLADFGIARSVDRAEYTRTGVVRGKIGYMSPEQAEGLTLDRSADVWAAGVVAWECIAGQRLFSGDPLPTLLRIINGTPPPLASVCPGVPPALSEVIASSLLKDLSQRCHSADELRRRLVTASQGFAEPAPSEEVADFVRSLVGPKLRALRQRAAEPRVEAEASVSAPAPATGSVRAAPSRWRIRWVAPAVALSLVGALSIALSRRADTPAPELKAVAPPSARVTPSLPATPPEPLPLDSGKVGVRPSPPAYSAITSRPRPVLKSTSKAEPQPRELAPNPY